MSRPLVAALAAMIATLVSPGLAHAEGPTTDYCQKVMAHADGDAAQLYSPTIHGQLVRFPQNGQADLTGLPIGSGLQPRAALSIGLVDIYKGASVKALAKADCQRHESAAPLEAVIATRNDIGRGPALARKVAILKSHEEEVKTIVRNAEERYAARMTTISEVQDLRLRALTFARRIAESEAELAQLEARAHPTPSAPLAQLLVTYERRDIEVEKRKSTLRNVQPWKLNVLGGVAATPSAEAYGIVELSYNVGGVLVTGAENRAAHARANELKNARYEMRQQVETLARELRTSAEHNRRHARMIEEELERIPGDRASVEGTDASSKAAVLARMSMSMIELEAEHAFLTALAEYQAAVGSER